MLNYTVTFLTTDKVTWLWDADTVLCCVLHGTMMQDVQTTRGYSLIGAYQCDHVASPSVDVLCCLLHSAISPPACHCLSSVFYIKPHQAHLPHPLSACLPAWQSAQMATSTPAHTHTSSREQLLYIINFVNTFLYSLNLPSCLGSKVQILPSQFINDVDCIRYSLVSQIFCRSVVKHLWFAWFAWSLHFIPPLCWSINDHVVCCWSCAKDKATVVTTHHGQCAACNSTWHNVRL